MEYLLAFVIAFVIAFFSTPIAAKVAFRLKAIDVPKDERRMHNKPVPLMGGIAIFMGFWGSMIYCWVAMAQFPFDPIKLIGMLIGAVIIMFMGVADDIYTLKPLYKLIFQLASAACVVFVSDTRIENVSIFFNDPNHENMIALDPISSYLITIFWIVAIINAINLIDGLDGLSAGTSAICSLSLFAVTLIRTDIPANIALYTTIVTITIAGACLGFLPFNFNPARIFMGETGAAFLGYTLGVITIQGTLKSYAAISIVLPVLILGIPLFDATFAFFRRIKNRTPISQGDRGHLHHRLIDMGLSQKWSVLTLYVASAAFGICAVALAGNELKHSTYLILIISIFIFIGIRYMKIFSSQTRKTPSNKCDDEKRVQNNTELVTKSNDINTENNIQIEDKKITRESDVESED